jgi:hypothetical protein
MKWINELTYEEWDDVMRTDADGFFNIIKNSLPILRSLEVPIQLLALLAYLDGLLKMFYPLPLKQQLMP